MTPADWEAVRQIYQEGITEGNATFESSPPVWEEWDAAHLPSCRLVVRDKDKTILGWAALSPVSKRPVYAGVAEVSVYVTSDARRKGVGTMLLEALIAQSEAAGIWTLQASVFPENKASFWLFRENGFRTVGSRERLGRTAAGKWRDVALMERRSATAGI
jgi:phosphinothricin acetyltransferase